MASFLIHTYRSKHKEKNFHTRLNVERSPSTLKALAAEASFGLFNGLHGDYRAIALSLILRRRAKADLGFTDRG